MKKQYKIKKIFVDLYDDYDFLQASQKLTENEKLLFKNISYDMTEEIATEALNSLSKLLFKHFGKKVLIFLDEYDTPMQEAYVSGYWNEFTSFIRSIFNSSFKTNPYMERAIMTGITRVSKESIFSDLNNLTVVTTTSNRYANCFGFTEEEVFTAMDAQGLTDKGGVKNWYDGFTFGKLNDIYNPWSIINYLKEGKLGPYWANTSSNSLVGKLIREGGAEIKKNFEALMRRETVHVPVDEQIVYNQLDNNESAIWSLLLATGYLKVIDYETQGEATADREPMYTLKLTNEEVRAMFRKIISDWFGSAGATYNNFIKALFLDDVDAINEFLQDTCEIVFSSFDTGKNPSRKEPERFYHGLVLGLMAELSSEYILRSNRESGFGRYDVMLYRKDLTGNAYIIEFKVHKPKKEKDLEETVENALKQIEEKKYDTELKALGFTEEAIRKYGFAFNGKQVLVEKKE